jgi:hypothetical protein
MVADLLIPGVEDLDDPRGCAQPFGIGRQLQKSFGTAFVEKVIQRLLIVIKQWIEFMWERKDHVEVRSVDDFCPALIDPDFFLDRLAVWAVAVTAGIVVELYMATVCTLAYIDSELSRFAVQDSMGSLLLNAGLGMVLSTVGFIGHLKYTAYFVIMHGVHLP